MHSSHMGIACDTGVAIFSPERSRGAMHQAVLKLEGTGPVEVVNARQSAYN